MVADPTRLLVAHRLPNRATWGILSHSEPPISGLCAGVAVTQAAGIAWEGSLDESPTSRLNGDMVRCSTSEPGWYSAQA